MADAFKRFWTHAEKTSSQFQALVATLSFLSVTSKSALKTCCIRVATTNEIQTENFIAEQGPLWCREFRRPQTMKG